MSRVLLDYDGRLPRGLFEFVHRMGKLCRWGIKAVGYSRTRHGWHVTIVTRKRLEPFAIVAAQAVLGSDLNREFFNLVRASVLHVAPEFWRKQGRWNTHYRRKL